MAIVFETQEEFERAVMEVVVRRLVVDVYLKDTTYWDMYNQKDVTDFNVDYVDLSDNERTST